MNVYAEEKIVMVVRYENLLQYDTVFDLFKSLYNFCKMLKSCQHFEYCYCSCLPYRCSLCRFSDFVIDCNIQDKLLSYRENEERLLDMVDKFHFYIKHIKIEIRRYQIDTDPLQFFTKEYLWTFKNVEMKLNEVIKNDIYIFTEQQKENH